MSVTRLVGTAAGLCLTAAALPAADLPRYKLEFGQQLTFAGKGEEKRPGRGQAKPEAEESEWQFTVLAATPDGGWRLLARQERKGRYADVQIGEFTLHPDGRIGSTDRLGYRLSPRSVLPKLPATEAEAKAGWTDAGKDGEAYRYTPAEGGAFDAVKDDPMFAIYDVTIKSRFTFDPARGLPSKVTIESRQGYGVQSESKTTVELAGVKLVEADTLKELAADAERYLAATAEYQKLVAADEPEQVKANYAKAADALKAAREAVKGPQFRKQLDEMTSRHAQYEKYAVEGAAEKAKRLGKPAADWAVKDIDGKDHDLKNYRGQVVVMDFWYRGCGWCVKAMPQMKAVTDHYKGKPVAVLGMNTDSKEEDAKFVIDKMGLNYPTLKAEGVPQKYGVSGFPTVIIVDAEGKVREFHVGYSADLKDKLCKSVDKLLAGKR